MMLSTEIDIAFEGKIIRIIDHRGHPWFVLADVCRALGIKNVTEAARRLDPDEKADFSFTEDSSSQRRAMIIVSEPGAMQIIMRSNAAVTPGTFAHRFRRWVTHEVLPSIRRFGMYPPPAIVVGQDDVQNLDATPQQRFLAECERIAGDAGFTVDDLLKNIISAAQLRALRNGTASVIKMLARDSRWKEFAGVGMDLQYVINGRRTITAQERRALNGMREAKAQQELLEAA